MQTELHKLFIKNKNKLFFSIILIDYVVQISSKYQTSSCGISVYLLNIIKPTNLYTVLCCLHEQNSTVDSQA